MTKSDLIEHLCQVEKLPKGRAELLVNTIFDCLEQSLRRGERIEIRGFGSFEIRHYRSYQGRNPRTGTTVAVKPKRLPFFKVGKELKERVNEGRLTAPRAGAKRAPVTAEIEASAPTATPATTTGPVSTDSEAKAGNATPGSARATA